MSDITVTVPEGFSKNKVLVKVGPEPVKTTEPYSKFRSFTLIVQNKHITVGIKQIHIRHLYEILLQHGFPHTTPIMVSLGPTTFESFNWNAYQYKGDKAIPFNWSGTECTLTSNASVTDLIQLLNLHVYDLTPGVGEKILDELGDELLKYWKEPMVGACFIIYTTVCMNGNYTWMQHSTRTLRDMSTIYLDPLIKAKLLRSLEWFHANEQEYDEHGINYKRIYMFHGPPGTGKSSTVMALASASKRHMAKFTMTPHMNSQQFEMLIKNAPQNAYLLIEDADALFKARESTSDIDFSTMLNCMDGLTSRRGLVVFMTTNHLNKLDPAFIRPGRVDECVEFHLPGRQELGFALTKLASKFAHEHEAFLDKAVHEKMSIAALQTYLFECKINDSTTIMNYPWKPSDVERQHAVSNMLIRELIFPNRDVPE